MKKILISLFVTLQIIAQPCLLYTSDAADERSSVDLGGRRIIKQQYKEQLSGDLYNIITTDAQSTTI